MLPTKCTIIYSELSRVNAEKSCTIQVSQWQFPLSVVITRMIMVHGPLTLRRGRSRDIARPEDGSVPGE